MRLAFRAMPASVYQTNKSAEAQNGITTTSTHIQHTTIAKAFQDKDCTCFVPNGSIDVNTVRVS